MVFSFFSSNTADMATRSLLACSTIPVPSINGTHVTSFTTIPQVQYTAPILLAPLILAAYGFVTYDISYCSVAITYTHPGQNDSINLQVWLPSTWNGRFQGTGGSGWRGGIFDLAMLPPVIGGYAAASTDAGHTILDTGVSTWALKSEGQVNLPAFQDFGYLALNELSLFGKQVTESFYGKRAKYSYWNGCSQGGRQGMELAQRYPHAFDGIVAGAPALNWNPLMGLLYTPQAVLNTWKTQTSNCELEGITAAAVKACDGLDGVVDGIIAIPSLCEFDPFSVIGKKTTCSNGTSIIISEAAATVAKTTWSGVTTPQGKPLYPGLSYDSPLTSVGDTSCYRFGNCSDTAWAIGAQYFQYFIEKNSSFNLSTVTTHYLPDYVQAGIQQYDSIIGTTNPDLTKFKTAGGKILSWHGLADDYIPVGGSTQYYDQVRALDSGVGKYYRLFLAPGVYHCGTGPGASPANTVLDTLVDWVEKGNCPDTLSAVGTQRVNGSLLSRNLCPYPAISTYQKGNASLASSYKCVSPTKSRSLYSL